jgi:predicted DNA-binding WGR domain protein
MKREFHFQDDRSNKFWTIEQRGCKIVTTYGRVGATPRETRKAFASEEDARAESGKQVAAKLRNGYVEGAAPAYEAPDWSVMTLSEDVFWRMVTLFDWKKSGDDEAVVAPAVKALSRMPPAEIRKFQDLLAEKLFALDTEAHAREIGEDAYQPDKHFSVDWFLYVRCCAVANGRAFYEAALSDPRKMPKDLEFEAMLFVADAAYERATGESLDPATPVSFETYSNRAGWPAAAGT